MKKNIRYSCLTQAEVHKGQSYAFYEEGSAYRNNDENSTLKQVLKRKVKKKKQVFKTTQLLRLTSEKI